MESFYRPLTPQHEASPISGDFNFDHPDAFDFALLEKTLIALTNHETVEVFEYDFKKRRITNNSRTIAAPHFVLLEGILALYKKPIRNLMSIKIFMAADSDTRLSRRVQRDIEERGRNLEAVLNEYMRFVKPAFDAFVYPAKKKADVIIPWNDAKNSVAIDLIVQHIRDLSNMNGLSSLATLTSQPISPLFSSPAPLMSRRLSAISDTAADHFKTLLS